jgi:hypothetical protein
MEVLKGHGKPHISRCVGATPNMYSMLPHKQNLVPPPKFCYELSMVCALMARCVLESSDCGSSGQIFIRAWACSR